MSIESSSRRTSRAPSSAASAEGPDDGRVLGDVVRLDPEVVRDRGVRAAPRIERVGPVEVDQHRAGRGMAGVGARRAVRADDEPPGTATPAVRARARATRSVLRLPREAPAARPRPAEPGLRPRSLPPGPGERVVVRVGHPLLERDDRVVGDLDVLRADLGAALRDVAQADAAAVLEVRRAGRPGPSDGARGRPPGRGSAGP